MVSIASSTDSRLITSLQPKKKAVITSVNLADSVNQNIETTNNPQSNLSQNIQNYNQQIESEMEINGLNNISIQDNSNGNTSSLNDVHPKKKTDKFFDYLFWATLIYLSYKGWKLVKRYL